MPLELRVALPGCRSCSRCSLAVPFQQRFEAVTTFQQKTYFVVLLLSAAATAFLIAPSAYHRVTSPRATSSTSSGWRTAVTTAVTALTFAALWFALPLARRARR